jgi:endogenous inhibitor of DNA gyrase (YacG/DUF329 family)
MIAYYVCDLGAWVNEKKEINKQTNKRSLAWTNDERRS